ncbi:hypothetical protein CE195_09160, partial [Sodalis-like symbiont of Philaenus spumarius]
QRGELKRISLPIDPYLEMTEIADRTLRAGGPALLFENPTGYTCRCCATCSAPLNGLHSVIGMITSDNWGSYAREVPKQKHLTGKIFTQRIERNHLTLRTRIKRLARKTICFSRSVEIHEKVIGAFIEKHMFY